MKMNDDSQNEQERLFEGVECELQRLKKNGLPGGLFAYNPAPDAPFREFSLAIDVSEDRDTSDCREVIPIGSYWLAPEVLGRLRAIYPDAFYGLSHLLFALQEFCPDLSATDFLEYPDAVEKLNDDSIQMFLSGLDELDKDGFIKVSSAIVLELEKRSRYQADKHDLDFNELLEGIGI